MTYSAPTTCPVCGQAMQVTKLDCPGCGSALSGRFAPCRFCALPEKELRFVETFLKCRGSIKDVERELGISYPTVRGMLDTALRSLNLEGAQPREPQTDDFKRAILDQLEKSEIDGKEAIKRLAALRRD